MAAWTVHKFGGTSVANAERLMNVARIITHEAPTSRRAIVVSAMAGVTDALVELGRSAAAHNNYADKIEALRIKHEETAQTLLATSVDAHARVQATLVRDFGDVRDLLRALWLSRECSERLMDVLTGYGELWCAMLLEAYMSSTIQIQQTAMLDARNVLCISHGETGIQVDWDMSQGKLEEALRRMLDVEVIVITGYIASTLDGIPTTLKRNGSDLSATIFASLLKAQCATIWKDVDGVYSADPKRVPEAILLDEMSYDEACELAYFGAKVIHPAALIPVMKHNIPLLIRNSLHPERKGTLLRPCHGDALGPGCVTGFTAIDNVALINVEGAGMVGIPGTAAKCFGAARDAGVSVIAISQASSEHSICFAVPESQAEKTVEVVKRAFFMEIHDRLISDVTMTKGCSVLCAVGDHMCKIPGTSGRLMGALGDACVNILFISQGSNERNISVVIDRSNVVKALRAVHAKFYPFRRSGSVGIESLGTGLIPIRTTLSLGLIGPGLIGKTLLRQLHEQKRYLLLRLGIDLRLRGILRSSRMVLSHEGITNLAEWESEMKDHGQPPSLDALLDHLQQGHLHHVALVDCTSDEGLAQQYPQWLKGGFHIVTPNKKAFSGDLSLYNDILALSFPITKVHCLYEATVGAGLPVLHQLTEMLRTGDRVVRIEGVLSGTMSYLFNSFSTPGTGTFSQVVTEAKSKGYTEPDPRDDLSGMDVARKVVILGREIGLSLTLQDLDIETLVPVDLRECPSVDTFMSQLPKYDAEWETRKAEALHAGEILRYVGIVDSQGTCGVRLQRYPASHPFGGLRGSDNILSIRTDRYFDNPLVIQGPGAGPDVTAAGVFGDLLRLINNMA